MHTENAALLAINFIIASFLFFSFVKYVSQARAKNKLLLPIYPIKTIRIRLISSGLIAFIGIIFAMTSFEEKMDSQVVIECTGILIFLWLINMFFSLHFDNRDKTEMMKIISD